MIGRFGFTMRILAAIALGAAVAAMTYLIFGRDKFVMFGPAAGALVALPFLSSAIKARSRTIGDRAWIRFLSLLPLLLWALVLIAFWAFFLSSQSGAVMAWMSHNGAIAAGGPVLSILYWLPFGVLGIHYLSLLLGREKPPKSAANSAGGGKSAASKAGRR